MVKQIIIVNAPKKNGRAMMLDDFKRFDKEFLPKSKHTKEEYNKLKKRGLL